jgi:predicted RND superfamily exporter protein
MDATSFHWRRLIITLVVVTALFAVGLSRVDIEADIVSFLPQGDPVISDALYIFKNHPIQDQLIIDVSLQEENLDLLVECGRRFSIPDTGSGLSYFKSSAAAVLN